VQRNVGNSTGSAENNPTAHPGPKCDFARPSNNAYILELSACSYQFIATYEVFTAASDILYAIKVKIAATRSVFAAKIL